MSTSPQRPRPRGRARARLAAATLALLAAAALAAGPAPAAATAAATPEDEPPVAVAPQRFKILVVVPLGGSSHTFDLVAVAGELARRHDVTVVCPTGSLEHTRKSIKRLSARAGPMRLEHTDNLLHMQEFVNMTRDGAIGSFNRMMKVFTKIPRIMADKCEALIANNTLMEEWRGYDMLLTFTFPPPSADSCTCLLAHYLGLPLLYVRDMMMTDLPINVPQFGVRLTREQVRTTWKGALKNAAFWAFHRGLNLYLSTNELWATSGLRKRLGLPLGRTAGGARSCEPWVEVISANWLFEEPHPIQPPQVIVGPVSPHPSRPKIGEPEVAAFAAEAAQSADGFVLVAFGSNSAVFGSLLDMEDYTNLALAFADLAPVRVLWLISPQALPGGAGFEALPTGNNTLVVPWAHINDILGHPACRAFVTHCGQKSVYEAMFHGVPIVGVPFMLEQLTNAHRAAARGMGVVSPEAAAVRDKGVKFTREGMAALVREVLAPNYSAAARQVGEAMRLAYRHKRPVERAAEEIELAMIHGGYSISHALERAARHAEAAAAGSAAGGAGAGNAGAAGAGAPPGGAAAGAAPEAAQATAATEAGVEGGACGRDGACDEL